jgi:hypothetical protein
VIFIGIKHLISLILTTIEVSCLEPINEVYSSLTMRCFIPMNITVRILRLSFSVTCFDFSLHKGFVNIHTIFFQKHNKNYKIYNLRFAQVTWDRHCKNQNMSQKSLALESWLWDSLE